MRTFAPLVLVGICVCLAMPAAAQTARPPSASDRNEPIIVYHDFNNGVLPSGWQILDGFTDGYTWTFADISDYGLGWPFGDTCLVINSSTAHNVYLDEMLVSGYYYCSSEVEVHLRFANYFAYYSPGLVEIADVDVRNGSTGSWHNILHYTNRSNGPEETDVDLTPYLEEGDSVQVRFHYYMARNDRWWVIDNFKLYYDCADPDEDNICSEFDNCPDVYNPNQYDFDNDGIGYVCDTCVDTDADGFGNPGFYVNLCPDDNCPYVYNPDQADADGDEIGNACDNCTDSDGDGFGNPGYPANTCQTDNCPQVANPQQYDADMDSIGDACDQCTDTDGDEFGNPGYSASTCMQDNCPQIYNPEQWDHDADGQGDDCDQCTDRDGDYFGDPGYPANTCQTDNCPDISNPYQADDDQDGIGDACDECTDTDGDGYGNPGYPASLCALDNCPASPNPDQQDSDADSIGDLCDDCTDSDADGFGDPGFITNTCQTDNCPAIANPEQADYDQDGIGDICDECTDSDGDGFGNPGFSANLCAPDNCPDIYNPNQLDADEDGSGDVCDDCTDRDGDGFGDPGYSANTCQTDNCPSIPNSDQADADGDGSGDSCDICPWHSADDCCNPIGQNDPPLINAPASITVIPGQCFGYTINAQDPDCEGDELLRYFESVPAWCLVEGDSLFGTAECSYENEDFVIVVSDRELADTALVAIVIDKSNLPPVITDSMTIVNVKNYHQFVYFPGIYDPDDSLHSIIYPMLPDWCTLQGDTVSGTAPDMLSVQTLSVRVNDYCGSDSLSFQVAVYLCADANSDGRVNVSDAVYLINYVFVEGAPPQPFDSGDSNCDENVNVSDAVYIINYIFVGGQPPCLGC